MWFRDEDFWRELYPYIFPAKQLMRTSTEVDSLINMLGLVPHCRIIDFGCGSGRHLLELARRGYSFSKGIDSTPYFVDIAKQAASRELLSPEFAIADVLTYSEPNTYQVALSLFSSFGYFEDHDDNLRVLRNMHDVLKQDGKALIDVRGKESFARSFDTQRWDSSSGSIVLTKRTPLDDFSKIENSWIVVRDGKTRSYSFTHWIYSARELKEMLKQVGFGQLKVYGGFDCTPYTHESARLIVVASK